MLRRLGIRGKVLAALSVPVIALSVFAGTLSWQALADVRVANTVSQLLGVLDESRAVATALQGERRVSAEWLGPVERDREAVDDARRTTDETIARFASVVTGIDLTPLADTPIPQLITDLQESWTTLATTRSRVDGDGTRYGPVITAYTTSIDRTIAFGSATAAALDDRRLAAIVAAHSDVKALAETYHAEQVSGAMMLAGDRSSYEIASLSASFPISNLTHVRVANTVAALGLGEDVVVPQLGASREGDDSFDAYRTLIGTGEPVNFAHVTAETWTARAATEIAALEPVQEQLRQAAVARASTVADAASRTGLINTGIVVGATLVSLVVALWIARLIVVPLRRLTAAAGKVREELPRLVEQVAVPGHGPDLSLVQIPVTSRDEVGQLAQAFNDVNQTTVQVAQAQAALRGSIAETFVNVARRDQVLLNRQLSFIDALERSEEDPRVLADLFRLDHLATRMRRNSESLLVLAGIESGRRIRETLPVSDVIRTASSEIEHYERVQLDLPADPMMLGHTVLPAAHLIAELLENATEFSDPGTAVHVSTGLDDEAVIVIIQDDGLGMSAEELAEANERISVVDPGEVLGSQRFGLLVVGRLAARLGAEVVLAAGPEGRGTLATVRLPLVHFVDAAELPRVRPNLMGEVAQAFAMPDHVAVVPDAYVPTMLASPENAVREVDLAALTDGATEHGLPRRRSRGAQDRFAGHEADDAAAAYFPPAPRVEDLLDAAGAPVEAWTPPVVAGTTPSAPADVTEPVETAGPVDAADAVEPAAPDADLPAAAPAAEVGPVRSRRAERAAAAEGKPFVVPGLVDDDEPWAAPVPAEQPWAEDTAELEPVGEPAAPVADAEPMPETAEDRPWAPTPWANLPAPEAAPPSWEQVLAPTDEPWTPGPEPVADVPWAPVAAAPEPEPYAQEEYAAEPYAPGPGAPVQAEVGLADQPAAAPPPPVVEPAAPVVAEPVAAEPAAPKRRGLFGRKKKVAAPPPSAPEPVVEAVAPEPAPTAVPTRTSFRSRGEEPPVRTGRHRALTPADVVPPERAAQVVPSAPAGPTWVPDSQGKAALEAWPSRVLATPATPAASAPEPEPVAPEPVAPAPTFAPPTPVSGYFTPAQGEPPLPTPAAASGPVPAQHGPTGGATFTPHHVDAYLDDEVTSALAQRADVAQQALAELSQLSTYRPKRDVEGASTLVRRTPVAAPAAPAEPIEQSPGSSPAPRDADKVRSTLSSFQSGVSRGRAAFAAGQDGTTPSEDAGLAPAGAGAESDVTPGSTSW